MRQPSISVIVPVFNTAKYLDECITSILTQTYSDFELLLVDDGSTDGSGQICDNYAKNDSRVTVFHQSNKGSGAARNAGLENSAGEWITFVDADDRVKENYLLNLFSHVTGAFDMVVSYSEIYQNDKVVTESYPSKIVDDHNFQTIFTENEMSWHTSPWGKLYRNSLIKKIGLSFFEDMYIGEDAMFVFSYMLKARSFYISSDTDYCYNCGLENTLTKRIYSLDSERISHDRIRDIVREMIERKGITDGTALRKLQWLEAYYIRRVLNSLYYNSGIESERRVSEIKSMDLTPYVNYKDGYSLREHLFIFLLKHGQYRLYDFFRCRIAAIKTKN